MKKVKESIVKQSENKDLVDAALGGLKMGADALHDPAPVVGVVVGLVSMLVEIAQTVRANKSQMMRLSERVKAVQPALERVKGTECKEHFMVSLNEFKNCIEECIRQAKRFNEEKFYQRILNCGTDKESFEELNMRLNRAIIQLDLGLGIEQARMIEQHIQDEAADKKDIMDKMQEIVDLQEKNLRRIQASRNAQKKQFLELKDYNELLLLNIESLPNEIAEKLSLDYAQKEAFLEKQFQLLHQRFETISPHKRSVKPPIPRHLSIPFSAIEFEQIISQGGFGTVYLASWGNVPVAVKRIGARISNEEYQEFIREIKIMAKLRHPSITKLYGACIEPEATLVMEYMSQGSLETVLNKYPLTLSTIKQIALDVARGLSYLHSQEVLHRDLKTGNILIDEHNRAKLTDFGLSKTHDLKVETILKRSEAIEWMAPELLSGNSIHTEATDVYAFGLVLWSLLTSKLPFNDTQTPSSQKQKELTERIAKGEKEQIPDDTPQALREIIEDCWKVSEDRPNMDDLITRLNALEVEAEDNEDLSPRSLCKQGQMYEKLKAYTPAFWSYRKSAEAGHPRGKTNVGTMYLKGLGTKQDKTMAFKWFERASEEHQRSKFNMALMLEHADGVPKDEERSLKLYNELAAQGNLDAKSRAEALQRKRP